jgi:uncharacterized lipoprotein YddW (UPF0748 family)
MLRPPIRLVACALLLCAAAPAPVLHAAGDDTSATWASPADLESADAVRRAVSNAVTNGLRTIVVPASIFPSTLPSFDGLADAVRQAHARGLRVLASIDLNRVAAAEEVPGSRTQVIYEHPEWLMIPHGLAPELLSVDVHSPDYVGRLARWTRAHGPRVTGVYLSPLAPDAAAYIASAVKQLVERYAVDGVELDEAEYPGDDFDYSPAAMERFRASLRPRLDPAEQQRMDGIEAVDPFAYADEHEAEWRQFRQTALTALVMGVRAAVKSIRPDASISAAVGTDAAEALRDHLQDWQTWLASGVVDAVATRSEAGNAIASGTPSSDRAPAVSSLGLGSDAVTR